MPLPPPQNDAERLDRILYYLERLDRRDRLRTMGAFIRSMMALVPFLLILGSAWYFYKHGDELIKTISETAAKQAAIQTENQAEKLMNQLKDAGLQR